MLGIEGVLMDREHALEHSKIDQTAYYITNRPITTRNSLAIFKRKVIEGDSYLIWSALVIEFNRKGLRLPES